MEDRVLFKKNEQRKFLKLVIEKLNCISLRGILQFGFDIPYSSLKNYYVERRLIPKSFFFDLCYLAEINPISLGVKYVKGNWGQIKGGRVKRKE